MTGESYSQRSADRGLNAIGGGDDDAVQTLSHHHAHRASSSDVNDPSSDAQAGTAGSQCSSYFSSASAAGPSSLVPAAVSSAAAAAVMRSPTIKAPRIVSSEYTSTAPSAAEGTASAAPSTDVDSTTAAAAAAAAHHARHAKLTFYDSAENAHSSTSSVAMDRTRASGVACDTPATSCAPSFRVKTNGAGGMASSNTPSGPVGSPRFQLQPPPVTRRRLAVAGSAASSGGESSPSSPHNFGSRESLSAYSELYSVKFAEMQDRPSCVAKSQVTTPARLPPTDSHRASRQEGDADSPTPSSTVSSSTSSSTSSCWYSQATFQAPAQQTYVQASRAALNKRGLRLRRSRSLPNMKSKATIDIGSEANHRLLVPGRIAIRDAALPNVTRNGRPALQSDESQRTVVSPTQASYCHHQQTSQQLHGQYLRRLHRMAPSTLQQSQAEGETSQQGPRGQAAAGVTADLASKAKQVFTPSLQPPITRQTLKELDLHEILKNPQLRHDVVYDANVQFRPNFDGERGRRKRDFGNKYWLAVQREIETGCTCTSFVGKMVLPCICDPQQLRGRAASSSGIQAIMAQAPGKSNGTTTRPRLPSRLPTLIHELRAICLSVLPTTSGGEVPLTPLKAPITPTVASERKSGDAAASSKAKEESSPGTATSPLPSTPTSASVAPLASPALGSMAWGTDHHMMIAQTLDPHLLTQQLNHSTPDVAALVTFVGSILKLHCAPMRDELIETMISTVYAGDVTQGLRYCFEVLELMKLDIANHQLRSSRTYLVETAVEFETRWFREQMEGKMSFERTMRWFSEALTRRRQEMPNTEAALVSQSKSDTISSAFDEGFLSLIFEPPNAALLATPGRFATNLTLLSNASLNHACTGIYPETFQFDAFRLLAFHGDVSDITIVYMLLLLFRQLSCSSQSLTKQPLPPSSLSAVTIQENASNLAVSQLDAIKSEIWTLLNDAELELIAATRALCANPQQCSNHANHSASPTTPTTPRSPATPPGIANRILGGSMWPGRSKFESSRWRRAVGDIVLQIASRATRVQLQARQATSADIDVSSRTVSPDEYMPSEATMSMLVQWLDRNLRPESSLHTLCSSRLRAILAALTTLRRPPTASSTTSTRTRKHGNDSDEASPDRPNKRIRLQSGKVAASHASDSVDAQDKPMLPLKCKDVVADTTTPVIDGTASQPAVPDAAAMERAAGLEPLSGEIRVLAERMLKVKLLHLRVFRPVYERMAAMQASLSSQQFEDGAAPAQAQTSASSSMRNPQPSSSSMT